MMKSPLDGLALGLAVGAIAMCGLFWVLDAENLDSKVEVMDLATLTVPLIAAYLALRGISSQISHSSDLADRARNENLSAARAVLPLVLSRVSDVANNRRYYIAFGFDTETNDGLWEISRADLEVIKECIQFSSGAANSSLREILRMYQILIARYDDLELDPTDSLFSVHEPLAETDHRLIGHLERIQAIEEWTVLRSFAWSLFDFARYGKDPGSTEAIRTSAIQEFEWMHDNGLVGNFGSSLRNNPHFRDHHSAMVGREFLGLMEPLS